MNLLHIIILAIVQGLAELLPVSSSAHVIVAEKLMGLDPSKPEMTLLLVMLHTGTMFAVILYFWRAWRDSIFASREVFWQQVLRLFTATLPTVAVGVPLILGIEKGAEKLGYLVKDASGHLQKAEVELLFSNLGLIAAALTAGGVLILVAGLVERRKAGQRAIETPRRRMDRRRSKLVPAVSGVFAVRGNDFNRPAARRSQSESRGIQFCDGGDHYPGIHRTRGMAIGSSPARNRRCGRNMELVRAEPLGHGLRLPGRLAGTQVAFPLAGGGALVSVRRLLPAGGGRTLYAPLPRLLTRLPRRRLVGRWPWMKGQSQSIVQVG